MSRQSTLPFVDPKRQRTVPAPAEAKAEGASAAAPAAALSSAAVGSSAAPIAVDDDDSSDPELAAAIAASKVSAAAANSSATSSSSSSKDAKPQQHKGAGAPSSAAAAAAPSSAASSSSSSAPSGFRLEIRSGDLFSCPANTSLAHCVSQCLAMGKGIAVAFKQRFGGVAELKAQARKVGDVAVLQPSKGKFVYYLITKPRYFHKPTYGDLESSLVAMATHMSANRVTALAMPRIGCGLDGLEWPKVEALIRKVFGKMNVSITVYTGP